MRGDRCSHRSTDQEVQCRIPCHLNHAHQNTPKQLGQDESLQLPGRREVSLHRRLIELEDEGLVGLQNPAPLLVELIELKEGECLLSLAAGLRNIRPGGWVVPRSSMEASEPARWIQSWRSSGLSSHALPLGPTRLAAMAWSRVLFPEPLGPAMTFQPDSGCAC